MDEIEGEGRRAGAEGQAGRHSSTHPSGFPTFLVILLPKTASLNHFVKPKIKRSHNFLGERKERKNNNKKLLHIKHEMKRRVRPKANTNIANVLSKIQEGRGRLGKRGRKSSRVGGGKGTKEQLDKHKR